MNHPLDEPLLRVLPPESLYAVGGRVRDEFRSEFDGVARPQKDLDYVVVGLQLADLLDRLAEIGDVNVVGASFAVVKLRAAEGSADLALPRRERSTGAGHRDFVVESGPAIPLEDDLARRDFRMNMIARAVSDGRIVDPYGGVRDIRARRIDILTEATFIEDPLRMFRAAQFSARFGFSVTGRAMAAMRRAAGLALTVSPERIGEEMTKLAMAPEHPSRGLEVLRSGGVLHELWPELLDGVGMEQNEWHAFDVYRHNIAAFDAMPPTSPVHRFAAVLHDVGKARTKDGPHFYRHEQVGADLSEAMLGRLRLSRATIEEVSHLVRSHMYAADPSFEPKALRRFVRRIGPEGLEPLFALRHADIAGSGLPKRDDSNERFEARVFQIVEEQPAFSVRDLAIGGDVVRRLIEEMAGEVLSRRGDPRIGDVLRYLFERVTDDPSLNVARELERLAIDYLSSHRSGGEAVIAPRDGQNDASAAATC